MATDASFADHLLDLASALPGVRVKKMFGEYGLFVGNKMVASICDNQVFLKVTDAGRALLNEPLLGPPYPGAKDAFVIDEALDDRDQFVRLLRATEAALPEPKQKQPRSAK